MRIKKSLLPQLKKTSNNEDINYLVNRAYFDVESNNIGHENDYESHIMSLEIEKKK